MFLAILSASVAIGSLGGCAAPPMVDMMGLTIDNLRDKTIRESEDGKLSTVGPIAKVGSFSTAKPVFLEFMHWCNSNGGKSGNALPEGRSAAEARKAELAKAVHDSLGTTTDDQVTLVCSMSGKIYVLATLRSKTPAGEKSYLAAWSQAN
jgi:hypothetical protein